MIIKHLGKEFDTHHFDGYINMNVVNEIRSNFYNEDKDNAQIQISKMLKGGSLTNNIYAYYFERVANDTLISGKKWTINEFLQSDELIYTFYNMTLNNKKIFNSDSIVKNIKTVIRLGPSRVLGKPTQFPIKTMRQLLNEFTQEGDLYYDPCMGWGMRMMCAAEKGLHYVGNDVNYDLMLKLKELKEDIQTIKPFKANLIYKGSEIFESSLVNRADFIFTSPPYFDLEVYNGADNLKEQNYNQWLEYFMKPMLENCLQYIKNGKYVLINIKNTSEYNMYDDTLKIAEKIGYKYIGFRELKQANRKSRGLRTVDNSEKIMVLQKL